MENDKWKMENGKWKIADCSCLPTADGNPPATAGGSDLPTADCLPPPAACEGAARYRRRF